MHWKSSPQCAAACRASYFHLRGLVLIVGSVFGLSPDSRFPGPNALYPCIGAALLVYTGLSGDLWTKRFLSTGPMVFVGLISYSLYLWHWPIVVFARLHHELAVLDKLLIVAATVVAATLSWAYVERPFKGHQPLLSRKPLFAASSLAMAIIAGFGVVAYASGR